MLLHMSRLFSVTGALLLATASPAFAQFSQCCPPVTCCQPVQVIQPSYQTVPVTEIHEVKEVVKKPVYVTKYVNQQVTEYHPVTERRTVEVPQVSYDTVVENRTAYRNAGYWQTNRQPICRMSPCSYDNRPNLVGWLNRTGYSMRSAFMPKYKTNRSYVPRTVAYNVPITRQVARHTTRKVSYNVTRMVAKTVNQRVAVRTMKWDTKVVTRKVPRTVYRQVPIGSTLALGSTTTTTALAPEEDSNFRRRRRSASSENDKFNDDDKYENPKFGDDNFEESDPESSTSYKVIPQRRKTASVNRSKSLKRKRTLPSVVRVSGWKKSRSRTRKAGRPKNIQDGPMLNTPQVASLNP